MFNAADYLDYWPRRMLFFSQEQSIFLRNPSLRVVVLIYRKKTNEVEMENPKRRQCSVYFFRMKTPATPLYNFFCHSLARKQKSIIFCPILINVM